MDRHLTGAASIRAGAGEMLPIPRHGSYRGLGVGGFHRLHYCDWGRRDNPRIVVCVHGYGRHARDFDVLARALSADFRVICPDLAGRGESDWLGTAMEYSFPQMLADLNALLSRLDAAQVDWVGTSLGGLLGMLLAAQPGTPIRRLVMNDVGAFIPSDSLRQMASLHFRDVWNKVTCPTLLLRGEHSTVFPRSVAEWMQIDHDGAQLVEIPDCGHAPSLMSPLEIDVIARFVGADALARAPHANSNALQTA